MKDLWNGPEELYRGCRGVRSFRMGNWWGRWPMCWSMIRREDMGYLLKICSSIEPGSRPRKRLCGSLLPSEPFPKGWYPAKAGQPDDTKCQTVAARRNKSSRPRKRLCGSWLPAESFLKGWYPAKAGQASDTKCQAVAARRCIIHGRLKCLLFWFPSYLFCLLVGFID